MKKKTVALLLALVLVFGVAAGGTLAWLTAQTSEVKNTFTTSDINIELKETMKPDGTISENPVKDWSAPIIPGATYSKNPTVTVKANSEKCYLFVKFDVTTDTAEYVTYTSNLTDLAEGWTQGTDANGVPTDVWYRIVDKSDKDASWSLIKDNKVEIDGEKVTKANMPSGDVTLTYTAYACQYYKNNTPGTAGEANADTAGHFFTPAEAWAKVAPTSNP